jgi:hypothetical protein
MSYFFRKFLSLYMGVHLLATVTALNILRVGIVEEMVFPDCIHSGQICVPGIEIDHH